MLKNFLSIFLFIFLFSKVGIAQDSTETNRIFWSDWYKIEWSDFQGTADHQESIAAQSTIGLPYSFVTDGEGEMTVAVNVCFIKSESWSKEEKRNNVLLQHEQLHFDIAELHRRMIVKSILESSFTKENHKELLDQLIKDIWLVGYREMQDKYDKETNFSRIIREQINWNKFVQQQLLNYKDYDYSELTISLINFDQ